MSFSISAFYTPLYQCKGGAGMFDCTVESAGCAKQMGLVGGKLSNGVKSAGCDKHVAVERRAPAWDDYIVC